MWWWRKNASVTATIMVVKNFFFLFVRSFGDGRVSSFSDCVFFGQPDSSTEKSRVEEEKKEPPPPRVLILDRVYLSDLAGIKDWAHMQTVSCQLRLYSSLFLTLSFLHYHLPSLQEPLPLVCQARSSPPSRTQVYFQSSSVSATGWGPGDKRS